MTTRKKNVILLCTGFLTVFAGALAVFAFYGLYPFGDKSILITDLEQQYIDFFNCFRNILLGDSSGGMLYNWTTGLGMNFIGLYAYYLSSPFSFIVLFFPREQMTMAVLLMVILKLSCASVAFLLFAKKLTGRLRPCYLWFSACYALMGFCTVYFFNVMWLDAVILLPVICAGVLRLMQNDRSDVLLVSLFALFVANFYISYMTGIAVFLFFLLRLFFCGEKTEKAFKIRCTVKFFISVLLAAGSAMALLFPAYKALTATYLEMSNLSLSGAIAATPIELIEKMLPGVYDSVTTYGRPNIYCGTLTLALMPLFFINRDISSAQKKFGLCILVIYALSFISYDFSLVWHVFRPPTWFNARHSFTFCFFAIYFALCALEKPKGFTKRRLLAGFCFDAVLILLAAIFGQWTDVSAICIALIMIMLFYGGLLLYCTGQLSRPSLVLSNGIKINTAVAKKSAVVFILVLVLAESVYSGAMGLRGLDKELVFSSEETYSSYIKNTSSGVEAVEQYEKSTDDSPLYRMENQSMRYANDGMSLSYNSMAHYSSLSNQHTNRTLYEMGVVCVTNYRYIRYYGTTELTDSLLGVKYVLNSGEMKKDYEHIGRESGYDIYKNSNALDVAFTASSDVLDYDYIQASPFEAQNLFISGLLGEQTGCLVRNEQFSVSYNDVLAEQRADGVYLSASGSSPYVQYDIVSAQTGPLYLWVDSTFNEHSSVYVNGRRLGIPTDDFLKGIIPLGSFEKGEEINVKILLDINSWVFIMEEEVYNLDRQATDAAFAALKEGGMKNISLSGDGTRLSGNVSMKEDGLLFTTIPCDDGWSVTVDGEKRQCLRVADAFVAVELPKGEHFVEFKFFPAGLKAGIIVSVISIAAVCLFLITEAKRYGKNNNYCGLRKFGKKAGI